MYSNQDLVDLEEVQDLLLAWIWAQTRWIARIADGREANAKFDRMMATAGALAERLAREHYRDGKASTEFARSG